MKDLLKSIKDVIKVPIRFHWSALLIPALLIIYNGILGIPIGMLIFVSLLFHEYSHIWMAQRCGLHVPYVIVHSFGAETQINNPDFTNYLQNFKIALAGPVGSLILFSLGLPLYYVFHSICILYFVYVNLFLGAFNLLPIFPLDGGRILYSLLGIRFGALKAIRIAVWASLILCGLGILYGLFIGFWWLTIVLAVIIYTGIQEKKAIESFVK